jgi:hypothetical protein
LETFAQPAINEGQYGFLPILLARDPLAQFILELRQFEIPVSSLSLLRRATAYLTARFDQFKRLEPVAASFTLIATCSLITAFRTFTNDISIRQESLALHAIELLNVPGVYETLLIYPGEEILRQMVMHRPRRPREVVERHPEILERGTDRFVVVINDLAWSFALFLGTYRNRHSMLVSATDIQDIASLKALVTNVDISR